MNGSKIKKLLKSKNISQKELALELEVTQNTITNWIKGKSNPNIENIRKMAKFFNISVEEIQKEEKDTTNISYGNYSANGNNNIVNNNTKKEELPYITLAIIEELKNIPEEEQADIFKEIKRKKEK